MLEIEKEDLLQNLACFGCEYKEDCEDEFENFEHGHTQCEIKYEDAINFASKNRLIC